MRGFWSWYKLTVTVVLLFCAMVISGFLTGFQNADELEEILKDFE